MDSLRNLAIGAIPLELWLNGFLACLSVVTLYAIAKKRGDDIKKKRIWMCIVILMYTFATVHCGINIVTELNSFTTHGGEPSIIDALVHLSPSARAVVAVMFMMSVLLADCLFIWRCWVVWERRWTVTLIPILSTIGGFALSIVSIVGQVEVSTDATPGVVAKHFVNFSTPYFILSLVTSLYSTIFIALRVFLVQREMLRLGVESKYRHSYSRMVEIIMESALIYSINMVILVALTEEHTGKLNWPENIHPQISGIAPTLIILRVSLGHARPESDWSAPRFRSLGDIVFANAQADDQNTTLAAEGSEIIEKQKSASGSDIESGRSEILAQL